VVSRRTKKNMRKNPALWLLADNVPNQAYARSYFLLFSLRPMYEM
jgi:hypothetical protein